MADIRPFAGLGTEDMLLAILDELKLLNSMQPMKDPILDLTRVSVIGNATVIGTLTSVSTLSNLAAIGALPVLTMVFDGMNQAADHLYSNIVVS